MLGPMSDNIRRTLAKNRNVRSPALPFYVPIDSNIDADYCGAAIEEMQACTSGWHKIPVTSNMVTYIPDKPGLYMFVWRSCLKLNGVADGQDQYFDWCLYVGKAETSLQSRFKGEYKAHTEGVSDDLWKTKLVRRSEKLQAYLTLRPLYYLYTTTIEIDKISELESKLIDILSPPLNDVGKIRATFAKAPEPAF